MNQTEHPVLYSFRRCPYAMRARLALASAGITVELREVLLRDKPPSLLAASPKGTVPVLVLPGRVIDESYDIMLWALKQADPEGWLAGRDEALVAALDGGFKGALDRYKYGKDEVETARDTASAFLHRLDATLARQPALGGAAPGLADYASLTFIRQFANVDRPWFDRQPWPHLRAWLDNFLASPRFAAIMRKYPAWKSGDAPTLFSGVRMTDRITSLEEHATHQAAALEELSSVVAAQAAQIDRLERRVRMLLERAAQMEADSMSGAPLADQKPPHW